MAFQTSQFDYLFILNIPIPLQLNSGETTNIKTPSIEDYYTNEDYRKIEALFMTSLMEVQMNPELYGFSADSYLDYILGAKMTDEDDKVFLLMEQMTGLKITKNDITCNGVPLTEEDVKEIRYTYLLSIGRVDIDGNVIGDQVNKEDEDELTRKMRESQEKIDKLKGRNKGEETVSFKEMIILIMYELGKSVEDLRKMNFFGITQLYQTANTVSYDKINKIAAGNGLLTEKTPYTNILSK